MKLWMLPMGLLVVVGTLGCGQAPSIQKPPKRINVQTLPELSDPVRNPDNDHLELSPPAHWKLLSRQEGCIFRLKRSDFETYPQIIITEEDCDGITNLTQENASDLAAQLDSPTETVIIGNVVAVAHAERATVHDPVTTIVEALCLETVVAGRKYVFRLLSEEGSLEQYRPYLYAVVNGARFHEPADRQAADRPTPVGDEEG